MTSVLSLERVGKRFGNAIAVDDLSLDLNEGEFLALLGASGCGKSTTLRLFAGLEQPTTGRITLRGEDVTERSASDRNIALMFQSYALYPHLTVAQNIAMPLRLRRMNAVQRLPGVGLLTAQTRKTARDITDAVSTMAAQLGLEDLLDRKPGHLSGGQQQRVALGRALVREPSAFLLDEPLSNLDTQLRAQTRQEIKAIHKQTGCPFLLVTHDQSDALSMADRVAVMMAGRIVQIGTPQDVFARPSTITVATFIGQHRMNILSPGQGACLHPAGQTLNIGVRPEDLEIAEGKGLPAIVETVTFHGEETILGLRGEVGQQLTTILREAHGLPDVGTRVFLSAQAQSLHGFDSNGHRQELLQ